MGVIIRQSFKTTVVLYIGVVIGLINRLFFLPNFLTLEQLGLIDVLIIISMLLARISYLGTQGSITKFFSYFKDKNTLTTFTGFFLLIPLIGYVIFGCLFYIFQEEIIHQFSKNKELLTSYYYFIFPLALIVIFKEIFSTYSINNLRLTVPSLLNEIILRFGTLILLLLIGYSYISFYNYVVLLTIIYALTVITLIIYCKINFNFNFNFKFSLIRKDDYKNISTYSFFIFLAGISGMVSQYTDSIMLASIKGFESSAIYSIAFFIGMSIEMPKRAITSITSSVIAKHWNDNNKTEIHKLYKQSSINQGVIGAFLFLLVLVNIDEIFFLLPKSDILSAGKNVAIIIGISRLIDMVTGVNSEILRTSKYYKVDLFVLISFIGISIISNLVLIPILGLNGAAVATLISVFLYNLIRYLILKKLFSFEPFTVKTLQLFLIILLFVGINYIMIDFNIKTIFDSIKLILFKSLCYGIAFVCVIHILTISKEMNDIIKLILDKLRFK
jgi:O-antigen/teichoic acid export membrane protein